MKSFKNILIVRTDRIGDVVLTTPAMAALKKAYPEAKISVLVSPLTRELVLGNPNIHKVLVDDRKKRNKGLQGFFRLVGALRMRKFDCAIIFHTKKRTNALCFFAGIPYRIGYKDKKFGFLLTHKIPDIRHQGLKHESEYCLDVLRAMDIPVDEKELELNVPLHRVPLRWVQRFAEKYNIKSDQKLIVIHPGASDPAKCWPVKYFVETIRHLIDQYHARIVLIGAQSTQTIAGEIKNHLEHEVLDLTGQTTVGQLAALLDSSDLLISNDSGPVHMAAGLRTAVISIFLRNYPGINPERWRPLGDKSIVVNKDIGPEIVEKNAYQIDPKRMQAIKPQDVMNTVRDLLD